MNLVISVKLGLYVLGTSGTFEYRLGILTLAAGEETYFHSGANFMGVHGVLSYLQTHEMSVYKIDNGL